MQQNFAEMILNGVSLGGSLSAVATIVATFIGARLAYKVVRKFVG